MNIPRLMSQSADALIDFVDYLKHIHADNTITPDEHAGFRMRSTAIIDLFEHTDASIGVVATAMKGGIETRTFQDKVRDYESAYGPIDLDVERKKRRRECNPDSAA